MNRTAFIGTNLYYSQDFVDDLNKEIEKLNKGYCPIKEKCNKGECDCTNEEYNQMCEENIKLDLEIERLNNIINKAIEYLKSKECYKKWEIDGDEVQNNLLSILQGVDKE